MSVIDALLFFTVIRERIDWLRLACVAFCVAVWVLFIVGLRKAI